MFLVRAGLVEVRQDAAGDEIAETEETALTGAESMGLLGENVGVAGAAMGISRGGKGGIHYFLWPCPYIRVHGDEYASRN